MSQRIETVVKAEKKLNPNVDFYSASTYYALGIPIDLFTPIFAVSRMSGWTAHVLEQYANNRLIRPRAEYIGPEYPQRYVALESAVAYEAPRNSKAQIDSCLRVFWLHWNERTNAPDIMGNSPRLNAWILATSATSRSSRTSITASRRWPIASSRSPARCRRARWRRRSSTRWTSSASAASPSRRTRSA